MDIWPMDVWPTDIWPMDNWPTNSRSPDIWPMGNWPTDSRSHDILPNRHIANMVIGRRCYDQSIGRSKCAGQMSFRPNVLRPKDVKLRHYAEYTVKNSYTSFEHWVNKTFVNWLIGFFLNFVDIIGAKPSRQLAILSRHKDLNQRNYHTECEQRLNSKLSVNGLWMN